MKKTLIIVSMLCFSAVLTQAQTKEKEIPPPPPPAAPQHPLFTIPPLPPQPSHPLLLIKPPALKEVKHPKPPVPPKPPILKKKSKEISVT